MGRDLVLDVVARKNTKDLSTLADEFDRLAKQTDDAGKRMHTTGTFAQFLDVELAKTKVKVAELGTEFDRTGNKDVFAKLRGAQANVKSLEKIKGDLTKALETGVKDAVPLVENTLANAAEAGNKTFWQTFSSLPPEAQAGIAAAIGGVIAVSAPLLGAAVSGAILAGVGAAGIGLALAGQIDDPEVAGALGRLKSTLKDDLTEATSSFAPVLIEGADRFASTFNDIVPGLKTAFIDSAPYVQKFFDGFSDLARNAAPGFERALVAGSKILGQLGETDLPQLGRSLGEFFDMISSGSQADADALHILFEVADASILATGAALSMLSKSFQQLQLLGDLATGNFTGAAMTAAGFGDQIQNVGRKLYDTGNDAGFLTDSVRKMSDEFDKAFGTQMSLDQANAKFREDLLGMKSALDAHSRSLADNSLAGNHNQDVVRGMIQDAEDSRKAFIDQAGGANASQAAIDQANAAYQTAVQKIIDMGVKAGLSRKDLEKLAGNYDINLLYTTTYVNRGTPPSRSDFGSIPTGRIGGVAHGGWIHGYAGGGTVFEVGENGPEYLTVNPGTAPMYVTPNSAINGTANSGGAAPVLGVIEVRITNAVTGELIRTELVNLGRGRGYSTVDQLLPVSTAR